jgi:hypothetical protein
MTVDEAIQTEKEIKLEKSISKNTTAVSGNIKINGHNALAIYYFSKNKFYLAAYAFSIPREPNPNKYYDICTSFFKLYKNKYGKPEKDENLQITNSQRYYSRNPDKTGVGLLIGDIFFFNKWELKNTEISICGESKGNEKDTGREFIIRIHYETKDKNLLDAVKKEEKEKNDKQI